MMRFPVGEFDPTESEGFQGGSLKVVDVLGQRDEGESGHEFHWLAQARMVVLLLSVVSWSSPNGRPASTPLLLASSSLSSPASSSSSSSPRAPSTPTLAARARECFGRAFI